MAATISAIVFVKMLVWRVACGRNDIDVLNFIFLNKAILNKTLSIKNVPSYIYKAI